MSDNNNHPLGEAPWFHVIFSTGFGTGFVPGAPGTVGAFLARSEERRVGKECRL